jgi:hypothetical protein
MLGKDQRDHRDRTRPHHRYPNPREHEPGKVAIAGAEVLLNATIAGDPCAKLGETGCTSPNEETREEPDEETCRMRGNMRNDDGGGRKDPGTNLLADDESEPI